MKPGDEDEAWRQIVENYGATPSVDDLPAGEDLPDAAPDADEPPESEQRDDPLVDVPVDLGAASEPPVWSATLWEDEGTFVPPPTPPIPLAEPKRMLAWLGVFGAPVVVLLGVIFPVRYPGWFSGLLFAWFVGGFVYLIATMPRGRDNPWDDGARL